MKTAPLPKCDCEVSELLLAEKQYSRWSDTFGSVWCKTHRVWVGFTVPPGTFDSHSSMKEVGPTK